MQNYKIIEKWECEFEKDKKSDQELIFFIKNICNISEPINPRDALFGGRTNAFKLYHKCRSDEKIKYCDFTSLYPYVQKYYSYPIGHPEIITENFSNTSDYFGLIKCKIIPPRNLYIPVLPARINSKLLFTLCSECAIEGSNVCNHSDEKRALEGTWVSLEINEALKSGYKILKIYEVWHYNEKMDYDKDSKSGGLFADYVDLFLKFKQEASGYPENVVSDDQKNEYIKNILKMKEYNLTRIISTTILDCGQL